MGYSNTAQHYQSSWAESRASRLPIGTGGGSTSGVAQAFANGEEKTMDHPSATAQPRLSRIDDQMHREIDDYDDDTTTIRSIDSITGAGFLSLTEDVDEAGHSSARTVTMSNGHPTLLAQLAQTNRGTAEAASSVCSVSTAPSTDEASSLGPEWTHYSNDTASRLLQHHQPYQQQQQHQQQQQQHRRVPSWEASPSNQLSHSGGRASPQAIHLPPTLSPNAWSNSGHQQQHVASFRTEQPQNQYYPQNNRLSANAGQWYQQNPIPPRYGGSHEQPGSFVPQSMGRGQDSQRGMFPRQANTITYPYPPQPQRKNYSQPPLPPSTTNTPPRGPLSERTGRVIPRLVVSSQTPNRAQQSQPTTPAGGGGPRSASEVLKTLLRKKACLYEPDTSRAVALVTWLVGRELALEYGFFSRQQLQAGVHACVASKINSGVITRTKVNRCMQIILNSCFHYIIPRSDGTEEKGDAFRELFANEMKDNSFLISVLPSPWNEVVVDRSEVLAACNEDEPEQKGSKKFTFDTPQSSPRLGSVSDKVPSSPSRDSVDGDSEGKRAVLLCFNENVRCAEDVFRCHNEFIRDTAHACHLQLSSNEWRQFFGREAASAPYLWGNVGIPVPYLEGQGPQHTDALGVLTNEELGVFRTTWCSKRYDHDHELCGFGHAEVNGGWLRRNPYIHSYNDEMCPCISTVPATSRPTSRTVIVVNECPHGVNCSYAHSLEEIVYHRRRYKQKVCSSAGRPGGCNLGDVCAGFHAVETYRFPKKSDSRSPRHSRPGQPHTSGGGGKGSSTPPNGSPILYTSSAPVSSYEKQLLLPGLQTLYRRHSMVVRSNLPGSVERTLCCYSCFEPPESSSNHTSISSQSKPIGPTPPPQQMRI